MAIAMLVVTVAGAGVVLYALTTMEPQVESISVAVTPADQVADTFDAVLTQVENGTFSGRQYTSAEDLLAQDCAFITYTVRLKNMGFFPAEWISLTVAPQQSADGASRDVLQLGDDHAYVLTTGSRGDLTATILRTGDAGDTARALTISCYVFGQKVELTVQSE